MSKPDEPPPPPPRANATIQLDALNADDIELKDRESLRDLGALSGRSKPPPLPPEVALPAPGPAPSAAPRAAPSGGSSRTALYIVGFLLLLGAAIYGGLKVGGVANTTAPAPSAVVSVAPAATPAPTPTMQPAGSSEAPKTITIPTIEVR